MSFEARVSRDVGDTHDNIRSCHGASGAFDTFALDGVQRFPEDPRCQ